MQVVAFYRNPAWQLELRQGVRAALPAAPGVVAWGLVTGVAMVKSGLAVPWAIAISLLVYAGSAQLATLPLIVAGQPFWIVALAAFVTNLRFVIYSASLRRWFETYSQRRRAVLGYFTGDFTFAMFMERVRREGEFAHRDAWFLGEDDQLDAGAAVAVEHGLHELVADHAVPGDDDAQALRH